MHSVGLEGQKWPSRSAKPNDSVGITDNNVMYDGELEEKGEGPVRVVSSASQLYPMGTVCNVHFDSKSNTILLRSEIRLEADWWGPSGSEVVSLVRGRNVKA